MRDMWGATGDRVDTFAAHVAKPEKIYITYRSAPLRAPFVFFVSSW